jgi:hypothetical protein
MCSFRDYRNSDFGHRLLCKCSHEQPRYTSVTRLLCRRVRVISAESRSRTGLVKMKRPGGGCTNRGVFRVE